MADRLALFDARRSKWSNPDGTLTREAQIFLRDLWRLLGGSAVDPNDGLDVVIIRLDQTLAQLATLPRPAQPRDVRPGAGIAVTLDAGGYIVGIDLLAVVNAVRSFLPPPPQPAPPINDSQRIIAARIFA